MGVDLGDVGKTGVRIGETDMDVCVFPHSKLLIATADGGPEGSANDAAVKSHGIFEEVAQRVLDECERVVAPRDYGGASDFVNPVGVTGDNVVVGVASRSETGEKLRQDNIVGIVEMDPLGRCGGGEAVAGDGDAGIGVPGDYI